MRQLRRVLAGSISISLLLALAVPFLSEQGQTVTLGFVILTTWVVGCVSCAFLWWLVITDTERPRLWLMTFLAAAATQIAVGFAPIVYVLLTLYLGLPSLPQGVGRQVIGVGLFIVLAVLPEKALLFALVRREGNITLVRRAEDALTRIESLLADNKRAIAENTAISQAAVDGAERAYHEANEVNVKIAAQGDRIDTEIRDRERGDTDRTP